MFDAFLKVDGIPGESQDTSHKGEIQVLSFHLSAMQPGTAVFGGGQGGGKVQVSDFSFVHKTDKASPLLFQKCCTGEHMASATFVARKAGKDPLEYLKYEMKDVIVSSVRPGGSSQGGDDVPLEEVTLNFGSIHITYQPQSDTGGGGEGSVEGGWSLKTNQPA